MKLTNTRLPSTMLLCALLSHCLLLNQAAHAGSTEIHQHASKDIGSYPVPQMQLSVFRDAMDGVNVHVAVDNYLLNAPDTANEQQTALLQGHAHVFVNGMKRQRLYGENLHIPKSWLAKGVNQIAISLNSHEHENWVKDNNNIVGSVFINLESEQIVLHNYSSQPLDDTKLASEQMAHKHH